MTKADVEEALVTLYLRLNGYFTTGFVVHSSDHGRVKTEVDVLAIRLPHNAEPSRGVPGAMELGRWDDGIDFIIGEVKSHGQRKRFNEAIRSIEAVTPILQWWGHLRSEEIAEVASAVTEAMKPRNGGEGPPTVACPRDAQVRLVLFSPETESRKNNQPWFVPGPPIFQYIYSCLHPATPRAECATNYGAGQWGLGLAGIVDYFKRPELANPGKLSELLTFLKVPT